VLPQWARFEVAAAAAAADLNSFDDDTFFSTDDHVETGFRFCETTLELS
jgi:hypothetical protein